MLPSDLTNAAPFQRHADSCDYYKVGAPRCTCRPPTEEVVTTPFGKFLLTRGDLIDETTRAGTLWDGPSFLQVIVKEHARFGVYGVTVLDVGAHHGAFSVWLAAQGAWRVVAVEPVPATMQRLKANLDLNQARCADVVVPIQVAAYGQADMLYAPPRIDAGNTGGTALRPTSDKVLELPTLIHAEPLDKYQWLFGRQVSLIKIDAQGCDGQAIKGLTETLRRDHPAVVFEWEEELAKAHGLRLADVLGYLVGLGYETAEWPSHPHNFLATYHRKAD